MKTIIYDIESDNLLLDATTIHCIGVKVDDQETQVFTSRPIRGSSGSITECIELLLTADRLVGHNIVKFDNSVIRKIRGIDLFTTIEHFDTLIASQLRYPNMILIDSNNKSLDSKLKGSHSLKAWGQRLGDAKDHHEDWSKLSEEMVEYCRQDVEVTSLLYKKLNNTIPDEAMRLEQKFAYIIARQEEKGVLFDVKKAQELHIELVKELDIAVKELYKVFTPLKDFIKMNEVNKVNKDGSDNKNYLKQIEKGGCYNENMEWGYWTDITFNPNSGAHIVRWVEYLYGKQKWELTEKGSPKAGSEDLLRMFSDKEWAKPLTHYLEVKKLMGQLAEGNNAWLKLVRDDNRIHGEVNTLGAVSRRCTHNKPNLAQVPSNRGYKGHEVRELFIVPDKYVMVGCDMSGLELRIFAHYLARYDGGKYARVILNEDIHTFNQNAFGVPTRDIAKTTIYGTLYGAGAEKIGSIVGKDAKAGMKIKKNFEKNVPAYKQLMEDVSKAVKSKGCLLALDKNKYFIRSEHSALNTLLQGAGALLCKAWCSIAYDKLIECGYVWGKDFSFILNIHDEFEIECREDIADIVADVAKISTTLAGEYFNLRIRIDGEAKIGRNWSEVH